jgi:flagellar biosynthesis anti-sigma factor FlgM
LVKVEKSGSGSIERAKAEGAHGIEKSNLGHPVAHPATPVDTTDQAALSEKARVMNKARASMDAIPEVRMDKVSALKEQVDSNSYQIPFEELAHRLLVRLGLRSHS